MPEEFETPKSKVITGILICVVAVLAVLVTAVAVMWFVTSGPRPLPEQPGTEASTVPSTGVSTGPGNGTSAATSTDPSSQPPTLPPTVPTDPPIVKEATATITAMGDILPHMPILRSYNFGEEGYIFDDIFTYLRNHIMSADFAITNLETTLAGTDNGYDYIAYPRFNSPDSIASALKNAGFDMLLTSNNHSYDTGHKGFHRTQEVLKELQLEYLGTKPAADAPDYVIKEINGIRIGMLCYTYESNNNYADRKSLNGLTMTPEDSLLISSFNYNDLPGFYDHVRRSMEAMEAEGADATVLFIHWGVEYKIVQNSQQSAIAQALCDLGVDVIVGGHPHVVQPMELLTNSGNPEQKTVCLYSMGNALSNQRRDAMDLQTGHTEDGVMVNLTFARYSDGTVILEDADLIPTWVYMVHTNGDIRRYSIYPLDDSIENWQEYFQLSDSMLRSFRESYDRTMNIVGQGLAEVQTWLAQHTAEIEAMIGVQKDSKE